LVPGLNSNELIGKDLKARVAVIGFDAPWLISIDNRKFSPVIVPSNGDNLANDLPWLRIGAVAR